MNVPLWKKFSFTALMIILLFAAFNFDYFRKNLAYLLQRHPALSVHQPGLTAAVPHLDPNTLVIESLGIKAPVQYVDKASETAFQVALINGVVHYPETAMPGEYGNVYIFGHSSDNPWSKGHYKTIFAVLPLIQKDAQIYLSDSQGHTFIYVVAESLVVGTQDTQWLDQGGNKQKLLTLQTSYPIGTSLKRFIVRGILAE